MVLAAGTLLLLVPQILVPESFGLGVPRGLRIALALGWQPTASGKGEELFRRAAQMGNEDVLRLLLAHGFQVRELESDDEEEMSLLVDLMNSGASEGIIRLLLENGASLPELDWFTVSCLNEMDLELVGDMLNLGMTPDPEEKDACYYLSANLMERMEYSPERVLAFLKTQKKLPTAVREGFFLRAVSGNHPDLLEALLREEKQFIHLLGTHPDRLVSAWDDEQTVAALLRVLSAHGWAPGEKELSAAFESGNVSMYRSLSAAGADDAALRRRIGELPYLALLGTDDEFRSALPGASAEQREHALDMALRTERSVAVQALLDAGVPAGELKLGSVAFDTELLRRVLSARQPCDREELADAFLMCRDAAAYPLLLEAYGDVNASFSGTMVMTLLAQAITVEDTEHITFLLQNGAEITPEAARHCSSPEILDLLLKNGMDINIRGEDGQTLLMNSVICSDEEMVAALLARGADVNACSEDGDTALFYAVSGDDAEAVRMLLKAGADAPDARAIQKEAEKYHAGRVLRMLETER